MEGERSIPGADGATGWNGYQWRQQREEAGLIASREATALPSLLYREQLGEERTALVGAGLEGGVYISCPLYTLI